MSGPNSRVFLSLGGNLGDPVQSMAAALHLLDEDAETRVVTVSSLYRTPPWGKTDQPDFLNIAAELSTALSPHVLLEFCLDIERRLKRVREDLDELLCERSVRADRRSQLDATLAG